MSGDPLLRNEKNTELASVHIGRSPTRGKRLVALLILVLFGSSIAPCSAAETTDAGQLSPWPSSVPTSADAGAATLEPGATWELLSDFRLYPNQENPSRDRHGNPGVWYYLRGTLDRNPQGYSLLSNFNQNWLGNPDWQAWTLGSTVWRLGPAALSDPTQIDRIHVHPYINTTVAVGWQSPIDGVISISGRVTDADCGGSDGVSWFIDKGATPLASGGVNCTEQLFSDGSGSENLTYVVVRSGEFIYFVVHPRSSTNWDTTLLDISIMSLGPSLTVSPSSIPADDQTTAALVLGGAPSGHQVRLHSSLPGSLLSPMSGHVGADGRFSTTIRSSTPGTAVITAQDQTSGQSFGASATVTFTALEGNAQPPLPNVPDGAPCITDLRGDSRLEGLYPVGLGFLGNNIQVTVDWQGGDPGIVELSLNDVGLSVQATGTQVSHVFDFGGLRLGDNVLQVRACNTAGCAEVTRTMVGWEVPEWLLQYGARLMRSGQDTLEISFKVPGSAWGNGSDFNWLLAGHRSTMELQVGVTVKLPLRGGNWEIELDGEVGRNTHTPGRPRKFLQQLTFLGQRIDNLEGSLRFEGCVDRQGMHVTRAGIGFEAQTPVITPFEASALLVLNAIPPAGPFIYQAFMGVPPIRKAALEVGRFAIDLTPTFGGEFDVLWPNNQLELQGALKVGGDVDARLRVLWGAVEAWAGLGLDTRFVAATAHGIRMEAAASGHAGYKLNLLLFEAGEEYEVELAWVCLGDCSSSLAAATAPELTRQSLSSTGWHLPGRASPIGYNRFMANQSMPLVAGTANPELTSTTSETLLVSNVFTYTKPALALAPDGRAILTWTHDDLDRSPGQGYEIYSSYWDGATWQSPTAVTADTYPDSASQVAWAGNGQTIVVWERLDDPSLPITATLDVTTTRKMEIAAAIWNSDSQDWSAPTYLTSNDALDYAPTLAAAAQGEALVVWRHNAGGLLVGEEDAPDQLQFARWDGSNWTPAAVAVDGLSGLGEITLAYSGTQALLAYTLDITNTVELTQSRQIFTTFWDGTAWEVPLQLTSGDTDHYSPQAFFAPSGAATVAWLENGTLVWQEILSGIRHSADITIPAAEMRLIRSATGSDQNLVAVWTQDVDVYFSLFDSAHGLWSRPSPLTADRDSETYLAPTMDASGRLLMAYADGITHSRIMTATTDLGTVVTYTLPFLVRTDLVVLEHSMTRNLMLRDGDLTVSDDHPATGSSVTISATITNTGDLALSNVAVSFYDGNPIVGGILIGTSTLPAPLPGGFTTTLTTTYTIPATGGVRTLYAAVDPEDVIAESDETDNTATLAAFGPDLAIEAAGVEHWGGSDVGMVTLIRNFGTTTSPTTTLAFYRDTITGTLAITDTVPPLAPSEALTLTIPWSYGSLAAGSYPLAAAVNRDQLDFSEVVTVNNTAALTLDVLPDLSVSPLYLWGVPLPDGRMAITVSVANFGSVAAPASEVDIYVDGVFTDTARLTTLLVPALDPAGQVILETLWDPTGPGEHSIYAVVNPSRAITEMTWANNMASTAGAAPLSDLAASRSGGAALLTWTHLGASVTSYEVWRSTTDPYFEPGDDGSEQVGEALPPISGSQVSYPDTGALGTSGTSYFYAIVPISASSIPYPASNRVGVFNFALTPGTAQ